MGLWDRRKLIHLVILKLLVPDVGPNRLLVPAYRRNEISARPELVPGEVLRLSLDILRDPNRAFVLNEADHLGDRVFWWEPACAHDRASNGPPRSYIPAVGPSRGTRRRGSS
jgi:hypothetical protein